MDKRSILHQTQFFAAGVGMVPAVLFLYAGANHAGGRLWVCATAAAQNSSFCVERDDAHIVIWTKFVKNFNGCQFIFVDPFREA